MAVKPITGKMFSYNYGRMRSNNPRTANKKLFNVMASYKARVKVDGFPMEAPFETREEIDEYFQTGDYILCLRCGRGFRALPIHLHRIHGWSVDQYKAHYALPWRRGLSCQEKFEEQSARVKKDIAEGRGVGNQTEEERLVWRTKAHKTKHRKQSPVYINETVRRGMAVYGRDTQLPREAFTKVFDVMKAKNLSATDAIKELGEPGESYFRNTVAKDPELSALYHEAKESLTFDVQAKAQCLGDRFVTEVKRLRAEGLTQDQIAERFGVSQSVISLYEKGKVKRYGEFEK